MEETSKPEPTHVLDASAVLALLLAEPGADVVARLGPLGLISAVNVSEVIAKLVDRGASPSLATGQLDILGFSVAPFDLARARAAGSLRATTRGRDISFADRACLSLGIETGLPVVTADRVWNALGLDLRVRLIR